MRKQAQWGVHQGVGGVQQLHWLPGHLWAPEPDGNARPLWATVVLQAVESLWCRQWGQWQPHCLASTDGTRVSFCSPAPSSAAFPVTLRASQLPFNTFIFCFYLPTSVCVATKICLSQLLLAEFPGWLQLCLTFPPRLLSLFHLLLTLPLGPATPLLKFRPYEPVSLTQGCCTFDPSFSCPHCPLPPLSPLLPYQPQAWTAGQSS